LLQHRNMHWWFEAGLTMRAHSVCRPWGATQALITSLGTPGLRERLAGAVGSNAQPLRMQVYMSQG
jgi:hypothetical protein